MTRDEIIKALEGCISGDSCSKCICYPIRWERFGKIIPCMENLMGEALALLKAEAKMEDDDDGRETL